MGSCRKITGCAEPFLMHALSVSSSEGCHRILSSQEELGRSGSTPHPNPSSSSADEGRVERQSQAKCLTPTCASWESLRCQASCEVSKTCWSFGQGTRKRCKQDLACVVLSPVKSRSIIYQDQLFKGDLNFENLCGCRLKIILLCRKAR